jgi:hypothetical protein
MAATLKGDQFTQAHLVSQGGRLTGNALLMAAVAHDHVIVVIDKDGRAC